MVTILPSPGQGMTFQAPAATGGRGSRAFSWRCRESLEGCGRSWGMPRILWSLREIPAGPRVWIQVVGQDFWDFPPRATSCPAHTAPPHGEDSEHSGDPKPGEIRDWQWNGAFQASSSPPLSQDNSRWQRGKKPTLGAAVRKPEGNGAQRGLLQQLHNPHGEGAAAHPPTPPLGAGSSRNPNVLGCNSWCLPGPPTAVAFPEQGLGTCPGPRAWPGRSCCSLEGGEPFGILPSGTSVPWGRGRGGSQGLGAVLVEGALQEGGQLLTVVLKPTQNKQINRFSGLCQAPPASHSPSPKPAHSCSSFGVPR